MTEQPTYTDASEATPIIQIPAPHFDQHQLVILHWNGEQHVTRVVRRYYDPDNNEWVYGVYGLEGLYSADIIDFR